jgi:uncharacterized membrane protein YdfJ with MMPL/SSD domain
VPLYEYELGSSEIVAVIVSAGVAIDYVVHLGGRYLHSKNTDSLNRISESLREMGSIITGGSITIILSVLVLFKMNIILIFKIFTIMLIYAVLYCVFYSLFFFAACLHVIGPNDNFGSMACLFK